MDKIDYLDNMCIQSKINVQNETSFRGLAFVLLFSMILVWNVGCGNSSKPPKKQASMSDFFSEPAESKKEASVSGSANFSEPSDSVDPTKSSNSSDSSTATSSPQPEVRHATGNVTGTGQNLGNNPVSLSIKTYFTGREKITFDIQIPGAMRLYVAENEHPPRTAQEFCSKILVPNQIPLPELPPNDRYQYDPTTGELNVICFPQGMTPPSDPTLPSNFVP